MRQDSAGTQIVSASAAERRLIAEAVVTPLVVEPKVPTERDGSEGLTGIPPGPVGRPAEGPVRADRPRAIRGKGRAGKASRRGTPSRQGARRHATVPPRWREAAGTDSADASARSIHLFIRALPGSTRALRRGSTALAGFLRDTILTGLYTGRLTPGDRLPSIRELAWTLGAAKRDVEAAYGLLNQWGITAPRDRSGMYVASLARKLEPPSTETATWVAEILDGACDHQVRIPYLPELLRRWTSGAQLRCACIESDRDSLETLRAEIERNFGVSTVGVDAAELPRPDADPTRAKLGPALMEADVWVTSPLFAPYIRLWADRSERPLVLASLQPRIVSAIEEHLTKSRLIVVCTDARFGERIRTLFGRAAASSGIEVVLASDADRVASIPSSEPVLLTWPAREALKRSDLRLLAPVSPAYGDDFARNFVRLLLRFNLSPLR